MGSGLGRALREQVRERITRVIYIYICIYMQRTTRQRCAIDPWVPASPSSGSSCSGGKQYMSPVRPPLPLSTPRSLYSTRQPWTCCSGTRAEASLAAAHTAQASSLSSSGSGSSLSLMPPCAALVGAMARVRVRVRVRVKVRVESEGEGEGEGAGEGEGEGEGAGEW